MSEFRLRFLEEEVADLRRCLEIYEEALEDIAEEYDDCGASGIAREALHVAAVLNNTARKETE